MWPNIVEGLILSTGMVLAAWVHATILKKVLEQ